MSNSNVRGRRVSAAQLKLLWEYLDSHRDIAVAYNRSMQAKEYSKENWIIIRDLLNAQGDGAHKDWQGWRQYWVDLKAKLKKRAAAVRVSATRTGGGPSTEPPLTDIENNFLSILGHDFGQGLPGVRVDPFQQPSGITADADDLDSPSILNLPETEATQLEDLATPSLPSQTAGTASAEAASVGTAEDVAVASTSAASVAAAETSAARVAAAETSAARVAAAETSAVRVAAAGASASRVAAASTAATDATRSPRRRHRRREPYMSQEAARRALVESSQLRADAAVRSARALEAIGAGIVDIGAGIVDLQATLRRLERVINAAFPRAAEQDHFE